jgi:nicotinamidase-related amidase
MTVNSLIPSTLNSIDCNRVALVITDPQIDFLSEAGVAWGAVGPSVIKNNVVNNLESLFSTATKFEIPIFVSPHYYYESDHGWHFGGALEQFMHKAQMFKRVGTACDAIVENSGADWLERYKPYIHNKNTVVVSSHKVYGPESNDLVLQLRKRDINQVVLAGMAANLCVESHMRELVEQGFEVVMVKDATASASLDEGDGYDAALVNFRFIASAVLSTAQVVTAFESKSLIPAAI